MYDSALDGGGQDIIYLFDTYRETMQQFKREKLRDFFETVTDVNLKKSAIKQYVVWLSASSDEFVTVHQINTGLENLQERIHSLLIRYSLSKAPARHVDQRSTKCYSCHNSINNQSGIECEKCGWIVCQYCGACGCQRRNKSQ